MRAWMAGLLLALLLGCVLREPPPPPVAVPIVMDGATTWVRAATAAQASGAARAFCGSHGVADAGGCAAQIERSLLDELRARGDFPPDWPGAAQLEALHSLWRRHVLNGEVEVRVGGAAVTLLIDLRGAEGDPDGQRAAQRALWAAGLSGEHMAEAAARLASSVVAEKRRRMRAHLRELGAVAGAVAAAAVLQAGCGGGCAARALAPLALRRGQHAMGAVQLALALVVHAAHAFPLSGRGAAEPFRALLGMGPSNTAGTLAVSALLAISGFNAAASVHRRRAAGGGSGAAAAAAFVRARAARLVPPYWFMVALLAFVLAPALCALHGGADAAQQAYGAGAWRSAIAASLGGGGGGGGAAAGAAAAGAAPLPFVLWHAVPLKLQAVLGRSRDSSPRFAALPGVFGTLPTIAANGRLWTLPYQAAATLLFAALAALEPAAPLRQARGRAASPGARTAAAPAGPAALFVAVALSVLQLRQGGGAAGPLQQAQRVNLAMYAEFFQGAVAYHVAVAAARGVAPLPLLPAEAAEAAEAGTAAPGSGWVAALLPLLAPCVLWGDDALARVCWGPAVCVAAVSLALAPPRWLARLEARLQPGRAAYGVFLWGDVALQLAVWLLTTNGAGGSGGAAARQWLASSGGGDGEGGGGGGGGWRLTAAVLVLSLPPLAALVTISWRCVESRAGACAATRQRAAGADADRAAKAKVA